MHYARISLYEHFEKSFYSCFVDQTDYVSCPKLLSNKGPSLDSEPCPLDPRRAFHPAPCLCPGMSISLPSNWLGSTGSWQYENLDVQNPTFNRLVPAWGQPAVRHNLTQRAVILPENSVGLMCLLQLQSLSAHGII